jgi:6-phosphogluconolactonase
VPGASHLAIINHQRTPITSPSAPATNLTIITMSSSTSARPPYTARVLIAPSKTTIGHVLSQPIIQSCQSALASRNIFTIALSGGSLPNFLQSLPESFKLMGIDPQWDKWHVLLADERCVPNSHEDSNLRSICEHFTNRVSIPIEQVYGIDDTLLDEGSGAVAQAYNATVVEPLLQKSDGMIDCVVLVSNFICH